MKLKRLSRSKCNNKSKLTKSRKLQKNDLIRFESVLIPVKTEKKLNTGKN